MSRLETLQEWVRKDPQDVFSLYGLAMEYVKISDRQSALRLFDDLRTRFPDYVPTYYHMGKTLVDSGQTAAARDVYRAGIEVARRVGDRHAGSELEEALEELDI